MIIASHRRFWRSLAALLAILVASPSIFAQDGAPSGLESVLQRLYQPTPGDVLIVPHRGDWRNAPENSLGAIRSSLELGAVVIEIDIRRTRDGRYVLMHDKTLDRTTTGTGEVAEHTLEQIRTLRLRNGYGLETEEPVPTLEEAVELIRGRAMLYLDKAEFQIADVVAQLDRINATDHAIFYGRRPLPELKKELGPLLSRIHYLPKLGDTTPDRDAYLAPFLEDQSLRVPGIILDFERDDSPILASVPKIKAAGKRIWMSPLWPTLAGGRTDDRARQDPDAHWGWLLRTGADMLCTDRPAALRAYLCRGHARAE